MKNIEMKTTGNILTVTIDISKSFGASKTGKSIIIGSTEGNVSVNGNEKIKLGVNCYKSI